MRASAGALFHVPVVAGVAGRRRAPPGCALIGTSSHRGVPPHRGRLDRPAGHRRRQRGPRPRRRRRRRRSGCASRTPGGPRASTWPWRPRCCASRRPGRGADGSRCVGDDRARIVAPVHDRRGADFGAPGEPGDGEPGPRRRLSPPGAFAQAHVERTPVDRRHPCRPRGGARADRRRRHARRRRRARHRSCSASAATLAAAQDPARRAGHRRRAQGTPGRRSTRRRPRRPPALAATPRRARRRRSAARAVEAERLDLTEVAGRPRRGHLHLVTQAMGAARGRVRRARASQVAEGPEVETDWHNFEALNMPRRPPGPQRRTTRCSSSTAAPSRTDGAAHAHLAGADPGDARPARRRSTSSCPGRVFRHDTPDATHMPVFHQIEGLVDRPRHHLGRPGRHDRGVHQGVLRRAASRRACGRRYFPFTEPSAEFDIQHARRRVARARRLRHGAPQRAARRRHRPRGVERLRLRLRHRPHGQGAPRRRRPPRDVHQRHPLPRSSSEAA